MVVLGDAGAGKTVLAVRFVLDQLRYRATLTDAARADEPVPVRVNAAGWDGSVDFTAWLANQLAIGYALNPRVARAIVDTGRILPVLDGLDEMDPPDAGPVLACAALERLNKPPWQNRAVVVACRTNVYAAIRELRDDAGLQFATTITLQPFSADDIYFHLEQYRDELGVAEAAWAPVTDQLVHTPDGILASALRTPWLLSLAATALHRGRHESAIALAACRDPTEIRDLLFGSLIPAAVEGTPRTGHTRDYKAENRQQVDANTGSPSRTAERLLPRDTDCTRRSLETRRNSKMPRSAPPRSRACCCARRSTGRLDGRRDGRALAWARRGALGRARVWTLGRAGGRAAVCVRSWARSWDRWAKARIGGNLTKRAKWLAWRIPGAASKPGAPQRFAWRVPGRSRWRRGLAVGLASGLAFLLGSLVASGFTSSWLLFGVVAGLILAIINGLRAGLGTTPEERLALGQDARRVIHDDLVVGLVFGLLVLGVCLVLGALLGLALERAHGLHYPLAMGLLVGLVVGMVLWRHVRSLVGGRERPTRHRLASLRVHRDLSSPTCSIPRVGPQRRAPACDRYRLPVPPRHLPAMAHRRRR